MVTTREPKQCKASHLRKIISSSSRGGSTIDYESDFLFPDEYVKRETRLNEIGSSTVIYALDGGSAWIHTSSTSEYIRFQGMDQTYIDGQKPPLRRGLLMGIDTYGITDDDSVAELTGWKTICVGGSEQIPFIVAHELIHRQQK